MPAPQTIKNHARYDPLFHFTILPILLLNLIFTIRYAIKHQPDHRHLGPWMVVMAVTLILMAGNARGSALKAQDRIIRLDERLRLAALLPPDALARTQSPTEAQFIALRFASDAELPALADRAVREKLTPKQIKQAIVTWRPDHFRV